MRHGSLYDLTEMGVKWAAYWKLVLIIGIKLLKTLYSNATETHYLS